MRSAQPCVCLALVATPRLLTPLLLLKASRGALQPVLEVVGPPVTALCSTLRLAGSQAWQSAVTLGSSLAGVCWAGLGPVLSLLLQVWAGISAAFTPLAQVWWGLAIARPGVVAHNAWA
jgi:hypothetical protein